MPMNVIDQLSRDCFRGVLRSVRDESGLRLERMTAAQLAYYDQNPAWAIRARCCAGCVLGFRTDSPFVDLRFSILSGIRDFFGIDVEIDGVLSHAVRIEKRDQRYEGRLFELPYRRQRDIRIHLPYTLEIRLLEVALAEDTAFWPLPPSDGKLLCLGDSITQGAEARSPFSTYTHQLARLLGMELLNQGVGGHIFDAAPLDPQLHQDFDLITVALRTTPATQGLRPTFPRCAWKQLCWCRRLRIYGGHPSVAGRRPCASHGHLS